MPQGHWEGLKLSVIYISHDGYVLFQFRFQKYCIFDVSHCALNIYRIHTSLPLSVYAGNSIKGMWNMLNIDILKLQHSCLWENGSIRWHCKSIIIVVDTEDQISNDVHTSLEAELASKTFKSVSQSSYHHISFWYHIYKHRNFLRSTIWDFM